jgi:hypothetical protein
VGIHVPSKKLPQIISRIDIDDNDISHCNCHLVENAGDPSVHLLAAIHDELLSMARAYFNLRWRNDVQEKRDTDEMTGPVADAETEVHVDELQAIDQDEETEETSPSEAQGWSLEMISAELQDMSPKAVYLSFFHFCKNIFSSGAASLEKARFLLNEMERIPSFLIIGEGQTEAVREGEIEALRDLSDATPISKEDPKSHRSRPQLFIETGPVIKLST